MASILTFTFRIALVACALSMVICWLVVAPIRRALESTDEPKGFTERRSRSRE